MKEHEQLIERQKANMEESMTQHIENTMPLDELPSAHYVNTNYLT